MILQIYLMNQQFHSKPEVGRKFGRIEIYVVPMLLGLGK